MLGVCFALDTWARDALYRPSNPSDLTSMFRVFGYFPVWVLVSVLVFLLAWDRTRRTFKKAAFRSTLVFWSTGLSGLFAILIKIATRRIRPTESQHPFEFRPMSQDYFNAAGLTFPSEHAAIAFAAALVLSRIYPRGWPVWWLWALACGATRVLARGHHLSDIAGSLIVAVFTSAMMWRAHLLFSPQMLTREE